MSLLSRQCQRICVFLTALVLVMSVSAPWMTVGADSRVQPGDIEIELSRAETNFPEGIQFSLRAEVAEAPARVELLYRVAGDATLHLALPEAQLSEGSVVVDDAIDLRADFVPAGVELQYFWRFIDTAGGWADSPEQSVLWHDTRFDWRSVATDQVIVHIHDLSESFGGEILASAQQTVDELEAAYGLTMSMPLSVWVYSNTTALTDAQQANAREAIAGVAYPEFGVINAAVPEGSRGELGRVIPHEVNHLVLYQATANPFAVPPLWLAEGLAVHYQDGGKEQYPRIVTRALNEDRLFSLEALGASFPFDAEGTSLAYAQSLSAVTYILDQYGDEGMARLLDAIAEGMAIDEALRAAFEVDLATFDAEWRASLSETANESNGVFASNVEAARSRAACVRWYTCGGCENATVPLVSSSME